MADSHTQTVEIGVIAQLADNVFQTIVTAMTTAQFEFCHTGGQVQFIVGHQNFIRVNAIKRRHGCNSFAAQVHKGGGHQQTDICASKIDT